MPPEGSLSGRKLLLHGVLSIARDYRHGDGSRDPDSPVSHPGQQLLGSRNQQYVQAPCLAQYGPGMARRYLLTPLPSPGPCNLPPEVGHHVARVLRMRVGDTLVLFDGMGFEAPGEICGITGNGKELRVSLQLGESSPSAREPDVKIEVAFPAPKGNRAEWLFEHGTEVGIHTFHPLRTTRGKSSARPDRWARILAAATGQCDRARIPALSAPVDLEQFLSRDDLPAERYLAHQDGPALGAAQGSAAVLLVGPEGGLTAEEIDLAVEHGFQPRNLGVTTLRTETAVLCGAVRLLGP